MVTIRCLGIAGLALTAVLVGMVGIAAGAAPQPVLPRGSGTENETYRNVDVSYDAVEDGHGHLLRFILTRPHGKQNLPAIFVAGWLSCDTVEAPSNSREPISTLFRIIAQDSNFVLARLDKQGVGDSQGDCTATTFTTELDGYRAAFRALARYDFIDKSNIFILGLSNGGGFAPLVPEGAPVRGYVVAGGWVKTWFEHMMEVERRRLALLGHSPGEVNKLMELEACLLSTFLLEGKSPKDLIAARPEFEKVWAGESATLYGRPFAFYRDLQNLNLANVWANVRAPTLALHGEYDWIMSKQDHEMIAAMVDRNVPGQGRFQEVARMEHGLGSCDSMAQSFSGRCGAIAPATAQLIVSWFQQHLH